MSEQNDAPEIPAALSAAAWAKCSTHRVRTSSPVQIAIENDTVGYPMLVVRAKDKTFTGFGDVGDLAALLALTNEALRRKDDPRAFTREHVKMLRDVADAYEHDTAGIDDDRSERVREFADALESMLPPDKSNAA